MSHFTAVKLKDENGVAYGVKHVSNKPRVSAMPYTYDIAGGNVANHAAVRKIGYNTAVNSTEEDLWTIGGTYTFPTTSMQMEVVSTSANDTSAGTGVRTIELHYLDTNYAPQSETITMNGTTPVTTVATDILRVQDFHTTTAGTSGKAAGTINIRHLTNTPIYGSIATGFNVAQQAIWTVPASKNLYIVSWHMGAGNQNGNIFTGARLLSSSHNGTLFTDLRHMQDLMIVQDGGRQVHFELPIKIPAQADVKITVQSDNATANAICGGSFEGWYETV